MRTRDRKCFQSMRTVWDISRDDRARIGTCSLLTPTGRFKENYTIDCITIHCIVTCMSTHSATVLNSVLLSTSYLPGFARVRYYAPIPRHMHPVHNCHLIKWCPPPVKQYITMHCNTEFIVMDSPSRWYIPVQTFSHHADPGVVCGESRAVHAQTETRHNGDPTDESPGEGR